jgi:hypothetical protein
LKKLLYYPSDESEKGNNDLLKNRKYLFKKGKGKYLVISFAENELKYPAVKEKQQNKG